MRETKADAVLLLVDTARAGAGMDGIYSAAREVDDASLFTEALRLAGREVTRQLSAAHRQYARMRSRRREPTVGGLAFPCWTEFDFLCQVAANRKHPGEYLHLLGLWPVQEPTAPDETDGLDVSRIFVDRLLGSAVSGLTPARRIEGLRLLGASAQQLTELESFLALGCH